jgi:hypothetical protein
MMLTHEENVGRSISTKKDGIGHANLIAAWVGEPPVALVLMNLIRSVVARMVRFRREVGRSSSLTCSWAHATALHRAEAARDELPAATRAQSELT